MALHVTSHRSGFGPGETSVVDLDDADGAGIGLAVLKLAAGERRALDAAHETAWLLMRGSLQVQVAAQQAAFERRSLFDELPGTVHVAAGERVQLAAVTDVELTVHRVANPARFEPRIYLPEQMRDEIRGRGWVDDAAQRVVRTIVDDDNGDPAMLLVLGEVIHLPGRWSSYPPHHHPQPELYHYRFTAPQGYGHGELGEQVALVRQYDTIKILGGADHAQVAAPGYGMYYTWTIRHLPGQRYRTPTFTEEHRWTMDRNAEFWRPRWHGGGPQRTG
ncbi:MAG: 5-deoxy-glucuronate isomerase [Deltaproteobacteria bacterium]|nr:5-deoxy-glucuronate isomerase [Deltaproteobacteria bacterium]